MFRNKTYQIIAVIEIVAVAAAILALILVLADRGKEHPPETKSQIETDAPAKQSSKEATDSSSGETEQGQDPQESESLNPQESGSQASEPSENPSESLPPETKPSEAKSSETAPSETAKKARAYQDIVFIGDSRTIGLGNGGSVSYGLIPDDCISAVWGGQLTDATAKMAALTAANKHRDAAVFWYGVNDVQVNPDRDNANLFIANYDAVIRCFETINADAEIYILSVITTGKEERDYYADQDKNVAAYNAALKDYCARNGFTYIDISGLPIDKNTFVEDHIHFTENWYRLYFIPTVFPALGLACDN